MKRPDSGFQRLFLWLALALAICFGAYYQQVVGLYSNLSGLLTETFGTVYSAIPFATLLILIFILRWGELHRLLQGEEGLRSHLRLRAAGALLVASPFVLQQFANGVSDPSGYIAIELGGVTIVLVFYGTSLILNPTTLRFMLSYAALYLLGVVGPVQLQSVFGGPLATFSSLLSSWIAGIVGVPVTWQGVSFSLVSKVGGTQITGIVTPGCSSVYSISTFLGLLGLMYVDFRKPASFTLKVAVLGVLILIILNAVRISLLLWVGYDFGLDSFLSLHNWVGYAIFLGFYIVLLVLYSGNGVQRKRASQAMTSLSLGPTTTPEGAV
ncbi:MAG: exosortase/archaeosortase family protein [Thaumarchaeota archaeon]|nr:exosortase/archaeosortase family protein [Nitrososphaerota archaeon]